MEKLRLSHTILYSKGWYVKNKEQWKDLVKTLAADGLITLSNEHEVAAYMLIYISSHYEVIKKEINCLSIVYMFDEVAKRQSWYQCSQDTAIIYVCLSLLSQLSKDMFEVIEADKKVLPLTGEVQDVKKYYYDIHVTIFAYSILVISDTPLTDDEAIKKALEDNKFVVKEDADFVDYVDELTEEEAKETFNKN